MGLATAKRKRPAKFDVETLVGVLKDRMKVCIICLSKSWGGLEQVAATDAMELGRLGLDVRVLCLPDSPIHDFLVKKSNVRPEIKFVAESEVKVEPLSFKPKNYFDLKFRRILLRLIEREGVNIIHTHQTSLLGSITPWVWNRRDVVLIASRHIMNNHDKRNLFHTMIYRRLDALVVMSQTLRNNVLETHTLKERQVKVIHLGLDFKEFNSSKVDPKEQRKSWGADDRTVVVGMVGRIDPAKGQSVFVKAVAGLTKYSRKKEKIKFVVVGEETRGNETGYVDELQKLVSAFHLDDQFILAGYKDNIPEVMRSFDVFVMPSRQEAFGLVAIEAMAMECPIVISKGGSSSEIVGQQEFGLLVRPEDAFDLQCQLRYLLDHPDARRKMGKRARQHVMKNYDRRIRLEKSLELYERTLRRRGI